MCSSVYAGDTSEAIRIRLSKPSFTWRTSGCFPPAPASCISIFEDASDSPGWTDNCLCSTNVDLTTWQYTGNGHTWSGMRWTQLREPAIGSTFDNYLYMPTSGDWGYVFSYTGAIPNLDPNSDCVLMWEPTGATSGSTNDNYFCWYPLGETVYNVPSTAKYVGTFNSGTSVYSFYMATLIYYYITSPSVTTSSDSAVTNGPYILPNVISNGYAATMVYLVGGQVGDKIVAYTTLYSDTTFQMVLSSGNRWQLPTIFPVVINKDFSLVSLGGYLAFITATSSQVSVMYSATSFTVYTYNMVSSGTPSCYTATTSQADTARCAYASVSGVYFFSVTCGYTGSWGCTLSGTSTFILPSVTPQHVTAAGSSSGYTISFISSGNITVIGTNTTGTPSTSHPVSSQPVATGTLVHTLTLDTSGPFSSVYLLDMIAPTQLTRCQMHSGTPDTLSCLPLNMGIASGNYLIYTADPRVQSCTSPYTSTYCSNVADHTDRTLRAQYTSVNSLIGMITTQLGGTYAGTIINGGLVVGGSSTWLNIFWGTYLPLLTRPTYPNLGVDDLSGTPGFSHTSVLRYLEDNSIYGRDIGLPVKMDNGNTFTYTYNGSMAYQVSVGNYMVLNLHAKPAPTGIITDDGSTTYMIHDKLVASYSVYRYNLTAALPWLTVHLERANGSNLRVIVNIHQYPIAGEWDPTAFNALLSTYQRVVAAVFSGYSLTRSCEYGKIPGTQIPVIHVGSRDQQTYLVVRLSNGEMETVSIRNSITGDTAINTSPTGICTTYTLPQL